MGDESGADAHSESRDGEVVEAVGLKPAKHKFAKNAVVPRDRSALQGPASGLEAMPLDSSASDPDKQLLDEERKDHSTAHLLRAEDSSLFGPDGRLLPDAEFPAGEANAGGEPMLSTLRRKQGLGPKAKIFDEDTFAFDQ